MNLKMFVMNAPSFFWSSQVEYFTWKSRTAILINWKSALSVKNGWQKNLHFLSLRILAFILWHNKAIIETYKFGIWSTFIYQQQINVSSWKMMNPSLGLHTPSNLQLSLFLTRTNCTYLCCCFLRKLTIKTKL